MQIPVHLFHIITLTKQNHEEEEANTRSDLAGSCSIDLQHKILLYGPKQGSDTVLPVLIMLIFLEMLNNGSRKIQMKHNSTALQLCEDVRRHRFALDKVMRIDCLGTMNVCLKLCANPSGRCGRI